MKTRKEMKAQGKHTLKAHYGVLVILCLIAALIGSEFTGNLMAIRETATVEKDELENKPITTDPVGTSSVDSNFVKLVEDLVTGNISSGEQLAEEEEQQDIEQSKENQGAVLGRSRGVLSMVVNGVTSGSFLVSLAVGIQSIVGSNDVIIAICIILSLIVVLFLWVFILNLYPVIMRRMFLEGMRYEKLPTNRALFLIKVKKWFRVGMTMLIREIYQLLWWLTIVGGVIKMYSYKMVPFIVAENPELKAKEAITLSRKMMDGHKWECFIFDLSFFWWNLLDIVTLGLAGIFFVNPYMTASYAEYYAELRRLAKENKIQYSERLKDNYLFETPAPEKLQQAYEDVIVQMNKPKVNLVEFKGIKKFLANVFGVTVGFGKEEEAYEKDQNRRLRLAYDKDSLNGLTYPSRLNPIPEKNKRNWVASLNYVRNYSIYSVIMMFFVLSFVGWVWEVSLHLIADGAFVNRGVLHGPWLPIYGTGGTLILLVLNKFRKNPALEFVTAIILCGCVEYFTSYYLEMTHNGTKWWDYSGYFLNLNGRICAEGLLVFGLGGMAIVYVVAPLLDNLIRRIPLKVLMVINLVLICAFVTDDIYSKKHPNMGAGITDYSGAYIEMEKTDGLKKLRDQNLKISIKA